MTVRYTDDEAKEILRRAMEREDAGPGRLHHEDLLEAAAEVGISPQLVEAAAADMQEEREARSVVDRRFLARKRAFYRHLGVFGIVNTFLLVIDLMTGGGFWFQWPLVAWGLFVALRAYRALMPPSDAELDKHMTRERRRLARRRQIADKERARRERKQRRRRAEHGFEQAVEGGVTALLEAIARHLDPLSARTGAARPGAARSGGQPIPGASHPGAPAQARPSDFDRYVQRKKGHTPPARAAAEPPAAPRSPVLTPPPARVGSDEEHELELPRERASTRRRGQ